ncbi:hypothetical protein vB_RpoS-V16_14 [Ruegeria phage vB_RpoS-V16]|uniref:hypothetical protein n=1 Tax=Ruegeria phage vB_RpoS-V16 TaxID=2218618 RepID=UPI000DCADB59|nr:hypothetical protein JT311_gp14 [Ruegeria phage vB_RpoS-V16]AWY09450.1 hypothetical protein vB_RpoS-V16_14 [Ruegeria phage vB_RpoS-V16]
MTIEIQTTPRGHKVGLNLEYRMNADSPVLPLYIIPAGGGFSTLGVERAAERAAAVVAWMEAESRVLARVRPVELENLPEPGEPGTLAAYDFYRAAMGAGAAYYRRAGRKCPVELTPELRGKEGHRVRVLDRDGCEISRFWVGRSSGWCPCHLEIARRDSSGGSPVYIPTGGRVETVRTA